MLFYKLFLLIAFLLLGIDFDVRTVQFESYKDMTESDLNQKGWIPSDVPAEIYNITVKWDIDTNDTWIQAELPADSDLRSDLGDPLECPHHLLSRIFRYNRRARGKGTFYRLNQSTVIYLYGNQGSSVLIYSISEKSLC